MLPDHRPHRALHEASCLELCAAVLIRRYGAYWLDSRTDSRGRKGLRATDATNARPRLEMRQVFMAGPDDEQVEAPTFLRGTRYA